MSRSTPTEIQAAIEVVIQEDGVTPSVDNAHRFLHHGGSRSNVTTTEVTVMDIEGEAHEILLTSNGITSIVSEDTGDTMELVVEGHTVAGGVFTRVTQTVTMNGRTAVVLDTALGRVELVSNETATEFTGPIYVYEGGAITLGKPDTDSENHLIIPVGAHGGSEKAALTTEAGEYIFLTSFKGSVLKKTAAVVDIELQTKGRGGVWHHAKRFSVATTGLSSNGPTLSPPLIIRPNTDVRVVAVALSGTGIEVEAELSGYYGMS